MKSEIISALVESGVFAVIRADSIEKATKLAKACADGGIKGLEITFTVPGADKVIENLIANQGQNNYIVGAGTVLDKTTARIAIMKGAKFIVSPSFNKEVAKMCNLYQIPYIAGCYTITEIITAMEYGVEICKIFPGSVASPKYIKAVHGPLPQANLMPTGGVSVENADEWIKSGAIAIGAGSALTKPALKNDYVGVTKLAKEFIAKVQQARKEI